MSDKREKSRQQWEQEIRARQQNVTPSDYPEGLHYERGDGLPKIISRVRFWLGIVLMAVSARMFGSTLPAGVAGVGVAAGLCLTLSAMRWNNKG